MPLEAAPSSLLQSSQSQKKMEPPGTTFSSSSSSSSNRKQPQPAIMNIRKNVSFNNMVIMRPIPSVESFTKAEKNAAWHSVNDLNAIKSRERALRNNKTSSTSLRDMLKQEIGIESKVEVQKRRLRVDLRLCKVLDEQDKQWDTETENPDELAKVSSITSQESMELAFKRAQDVAKQIHIDRDNRNNNRKKYPPMTRVGRSAGNMLLMTGGGNTNRRSSSRDMLSKFTGGGLGLGSGSSSKKNGNATWGIQTTAGGGSNMLNNSHKSTGGMMMMMRSKNMFLGSSALSPTRSSSSGKNGNASWKVTTSTTTTTTEDGQHEHEHEHDDTTNRDEDDDPTLYNPTPQSSNPKIKSILRSSSKIGDAHVYQSSPALLTTGINCLQRPQPVPPPPPLPTSPAYDRWNAISSKSKSKTKTKTTTLGSNSSGGGNNNMSNQQWNVTSPPTTTTKSSAGNTTKPKYDLQKLAGLVGVASPA